MLFKLPLALICWDYDSGNNGINFILLVIRGSILIVTLVIWLIFILKCKPFATNAKSMIVTAKLNLFLKFLVIFISLFSLAISILNTMDMDYNGYFNYLLLVLRIIVFIFHFILFIVTVVVFLFRFAHFQKIVRSGMQTISFSMTYDKNNWLKKMEVEQTDSVINFADERKFQLWQGFWDFIFDNDPLYKIPISIRTNKRNINNLNFNSNDKCTPPMLINFNGTIGERHLENKYIASHESIDSFEENIDTFVDDIYQNHELLTLFGEIVLRLQGCDVYWDGECFYSTIQNSKIKCIEQTLNRSVTKFGHLSIVPFPLCVKIVFDEGQESVFRYVVFCFVEISSNFRQVKIKVSPLVFVCVVFRHV